MYIPIEGVMFMSIRVQFVLSDTEYAKLKDLADDEGVSISKYVKDRVFPDSEVDSFKAIWDEFHAKLVAFPSNVEFNVATIMTQERWKTFDRSTKLSIAKLFNKKVNTKAKDFDNITIVGRSPTNVSIYKKC